MTTPDVSGLGDPSFDRYARMVRRTLEVPVGLVTIVERNRQIFPGALGLPEPYQTARETPLSHSFCQYVVADRAPLVISDARQDPRLRDNLAIDDLHVIAYAGWPLTDQTGAVIGSLCAIDSRPRTWTEDDLLHLEDLAAACSAELAQRELRRQAADDAARSRALTARSTVLLGLSESLSRTRTLEDIAVAVGEVGLNEFGCERAGLWLDLHPDQDSSHDPSGPRPVAGPLRFVPNTRTEWPQAAAYSSVDVGSSTPIGEAAAGRVPLFFADQVAQDARYERHTSLPETGQARAFMPLRLGGHVYGTLVLTWPEPHDFTADDRATIAAVTAYTAQAVQRALLLRERVEASITLQSAMLSEIPQPADLDIVARYRPAAERDQVGGDWYDAVLLPSGCTMLLIGDVVGHDIEAAARMGQLRNTLRAFAWVADDPPAVLVDRLEGAMPGLGLDVLATLILARIEQSPDDLDQGMRVLRWTNAGHPPPLLLHPDGTTSWLDDGARGALLGLGFGIAPDREEASVRIETDATLLLFTDGLVEVRGESLDTGLARLAAAVERHHRLTLERLVDHVLDDLLGPRLDDDVAVLAVRFRAQARSPA